MLIIDIASSLGACSLVNIHSNLNVFQGGLKRLFNCLNLIWPSARRFGHFYMLIIVILNAPFDIKLIQFFLFLFLMQSVGEESRGSHRVGKEAALQSGECWYDRWPTSFPKNSESQSSRVSLTTQEEHSHTDFKSQQTPLLSSKRNLLDKRRGVCWLLKSVWECSYRVNKGVSPRLKETETSPVADDTARRFTVTWMTESLHQHVWR